jgi:Ca-activated chloride channel family protein
MRFLWPELLWLLLLVPALVAAYFEILRRKKKAAVRYASLSLVRAALGPGQALRRHLPPALFLAAMTAAILAMARPTAVVTLPSEHVTLVLSMDVSRSMLATDVAPNRISAAQAAAKAFISELPRNVRVGITTFAGTANVVQTPTEDKELLNAAVDRFQLQRATATGAGLLVSLGLLLPEAGIDVESAMFRGYGDPVEPRGSPLPSARKDKARPKPAPVPPGSYTAGAIVLMSDGRRTSGPDPIEAARQAANLGVRVHTVGFGSNAGGDVPGFEGGWSFFARLDEPTLKEIARITGGEYFRAATAGELRKIYLELNSKLGLERQETEVSALFTAITALFTFGAAALSLAWFWRRS